MLGILSLIFWSLVLIVTVKYVLLVMRADNRGEGGILALMALAQRVAADAAHARRRSALVGIAGACLFFGDGMITPGDLGAVRRRRAGGRGARSSQQFVLPISASS